jgi:hypothetical protein
MSNSPKCNDKRCPVCYPNWKEEEAAAIKRAEDDKQDCIDGWGYYQKQAEAIVAVGDPIARNRRINAAYATLWLEDRRFQWAGLAAFVSKQVGCGLLNAAEMIGKSNQQRRAYQQWERQRPAADQFSPFASPRMPAADQATGEVAHKVYQMLAKGNTALRQERFSNKPLANLADAGQRMAFVMRAAERFDQLLRDPIEGVLVENSIYLIAHGR